METKIESLAQESSIDSINSEIQQLLSKMDLPEDWSAIIKFIILFCIVVGIALLLQYVARKILNIVFARIEKTIPLAFFKYTRSNKLPHFLALVIPYSFLRGSIPVVFSNLPALISPTQSLIDVALVFFVISMIMAIFRSFSDALQEKPAFKDKPMKSYLQVIQIILFILGAVVIFSIITGKSVTAIFAALGAASAITMLVFKDSIMGFVSSIQLTTNDMVKLGDWITMAKYGADGNVIDISLTTVKIQNFDKTVTTIPTYSLISDSFQNWRGMEEAGGRRIKRPLYIKQDTIHFLTKEELAKYKEVDCLRNFIETREKKYELLNRGVDPFAEIGAHRITNNELFIAYGIEYLEKHPRINHDMATNVRQRSCTASGVEVEVYVFSQATSAAGNEDITTEIFNHLIGVVKYFNLEIFENSSCTDNYNVFMTQKA